MRNLFNGRKRRNTSEPTVIAGDFATDSARTRIAAATDVAALVDALRDTARAVVVSDGVTIAWRAGNDTRYGSDDIAGLSNADQPFPIATVVGDMAIRAQAVTIVPDIRADYTVSQNAYLSTFIRTVVVVPVSLADPALAIGAYWQAVNAASPEAIGRLNWLAALGAVAIARIAGPAAQRP